MLIMALSSLAIRLDYFIQMEDLAPLFHFKAPTKE